MHLHMKDRDGCGRGKSRRGRGRTQGRCGWGKREQDGAGRGGGEGIGGVRSPTYSIRGLITSLCHGPLRRHLNSWQGEDTGLSWLEGLPDGGKERRGGTQVDEE